MMLSPRAGTMSHTARLLTVTSPFCIISRRNETTLMKIMENAKVAGHHGSQLRSQR